MMVQTVLNMWNETNCSAQFLFLEGFAAGSSFVFVDYALTSSSAPLKAARWKEGQYTFVQDRMPYEQE